MSLNTLLGLIKNFVADFTKTNPVIILSEENLNQYGSAIAKELRNQKFSTMITDAQDKRTVFDSCQFQDISVESKQDGSGFICKLTVTDKSRHHFIVEIASGDEVIFDQNQEQLKIVLSSYNSITNSTSKITFLISK